MKKRKIRKTEPVSAIADDIKIFLNHDLPQPVPMIDVLREEAAKESVCDKARRLARKEETLRRQQVEKDKQVFLDQFDLVAYWDDDHEYELCGYKWVCHNSVWPQFEPQYALYLKYYPSSYYFQKVTSIISLGRLVLLVDTERGKASLDAAKAYLAVPWWKRAWRYLFS